LNKEFIDLWTEVRDLKLKYENEIFVIKDTMRKAREAEAFKKHTKEFYWMTAAEQKISFERVYKDGII
jgi:hypothetical protein